jgi:hypothetical protein
LGSHVEPATNGFSEAVFGLLLHLAQHCMSCNEFGSEGMHLDGVLDFDRMALAENAIGGKAPGSKTSRSNTYVSITPICYPVGLGGQHPAGSRERLRGFGSGSPALPSTARLS